MPEPIAHTLRETMLPLGLVNYTVDTKIARDGDYAILEIDPQCHFPYVGTLTRMPIGGAALARPLAGAGPA